MYKTANRFMQSLSRADGSDKEKLKKQTKAWLKKKRGQGKVAIGKKSSGKIQAWRATEKPGG